MILIFGKNGQVATKLRAFEEVNALGRDQVDFTDPKACEHAINFYKPQAVINAAAYTKVDKAEGEENLANIINAEAPGKMALACANLEIPLVHISTDYVFDGTRTIPWAVSDRPNPTTAYGRSKLKGEQAIQATECAYVILRTSWIFSAHGNNFLKTMLRLSEKRDSLSVVEDQVGGPTCASDIAHACLSIAKQLIEDPSKTGIYHYSGKPDVSWCKFANTIFERARRETVVTPITSSEYPTPALRPLNSRLDCKFTKEVFGIPRPDWHDCLEQILSDLENMHDNT